MISNTLNLSKAEWRQVSAVAARIDWARHSADQRHVELEASLGDRGMAALHQLLRVM